MTLEGKRIVITRAAHQYSELAVLLAAQGAQPLAYPTIQIVPPQRDELFEEGLKALKQGGFDWVIFTSANAVEQIAAHLDTARLPRQTRTAAVGAATASALIKHFAVTPQVLPSWADTDHLLDALPLKSGSCVLLPQSEIAPPNFAKRLGDRGVEVVAITAYRVIIGSGGIHLPTLIAIREVDAITFTSGSTVDHFLLRYALEGGTYADLSGIPLACLGQSAHNALRGAGLIVSTSAFTHTMEALVTALRDYFYEA